MNADVVVVVPFEALLDVFRMKPAKLLGREGNSGKLPERRRW